MSCKCNKSIEAFYYKTPLDEKWEFYTIAGDEKLAKRYYWYPEDPCNCKTYIIISQFILYNNDNTKYELFNKKIMEDGIKYMFDNSETAIRFKC